MFSLRIIAGITSFFLAATPALVHAAAACHCGDHQRRHLAAKVARQKSCCHKSADTGRTETCKRIDRHRCCSKQLIELERALATNDKRPAVDAILVAPDSCVLALLAPPTHQSIICSPRSSRAPPGPTLQQLCVLLS